MSTISYPYNLVQGLSDFWQRFFADSDQLDSMYQGATYLVAQAYLDMLSNVLSVAIVDCPILSKEYWRLLTIREDEISYSANGRHNFPTPEGVVDIESVNNRVVDISASLERSIDFDIDRTKISFKVDPTNPALPGYAYRQLSVEVGGRFDTEFRGVTFVSWVSGTPVEKGDILRLLFLGPAPDLNQSKVIDYRIVLVRDNALYLADGSVLAATAVAGLTYTILRVPTDSVVLLEKLVFVGTTATLAHSRIVKGSIRLYGTVLATGTDVQEDVDYRVDYERGKIIRLTAWIPAVNNINYQWLVGVFPATNGPPPYGTDGVLDSTRIATVTQVALWAPDIRVDRRLLSNNFGTLIGKEADSSEAYRSFLAGIFQLYVLGPVFNRVESALNVVLGLPVVKTDGEILLGYSTADPNVNLVSVTRADGIEASYAFPKITPIRADVADPANAGILTFNAFEVLTTAVLVTDYIQDPAWWHYIVIPKELYQASGGAVVPDALKRTISPLYVANVINPEDGAVIGDPGVIIGADDEGNVVPLGQPVYRHRTSFVLMDRFLKFHIFYVRFDPSVFVDTGTNVAFARDPTELRRLVLSAKPSHTYVYGQPTTAFLDSIFVAEDRWYQAQRYAGADYDATELYDNSGDVPNLNEPRVHLGLFIGPNARFSTDKVLFTMSELLIGVNGWAVGDFFRYEYFSQGANFGGAGIVTASNAPGAPRTRRLVRLYLTAMVAGFKAVEGIDYTVNYETATVTRLTAWTSNSVTMYYIQLNVGNVATAAPSRSDGDMDLVINQIDPALIRGNYAPDTGDPISLVERALTIKIS